MSLSPSLVILPNDIRAASVALYDASGNQLSGFDSSRPATATLTSVPASVTSVVLAALNAARRQLIIVNNGSKTLYVAFAATATTSAFSFIISSNATWIGNMNSYTGVVSGIWSAVNGNAQVTEIAT
jgi:hypothetical protein